MPSLFSLLNIKSGVLPVSSIRINCFSDISILSYEQWSSNRQCHPVLAACLSAHLTKADVEPMCGRLGWWEGGVGFFCFFLILFSYFYYRRFRQKRQMKMETDVGFLKKVEKEKDRIIDQKHQLIFYT